MTNRPRSPGFALAAIATVLLALIALFALTTRREPPPTIAEFAPQSTEQITDAPDDQSSSSGTGAGVGSGNGAAGAPTPSPAPPAVTYRRCIGDPPRQIEDPQGPPCVPFWQGDNGGVTSPGVTRDEVRIAHPKGGAHYDQLLSFFNQRFEFYGRRLTLVPSTAQPNTHEETSGGVDAASGNVFASHGLYNSWGYHLELAKHGVISVTRDSMFPEDEAAGRDPYIWSYLMGPYEQQRNLGAWTCNRLAGRPANHAGPGTAGKPRVFSIFHEYQRGSAITVEPLEASLRACGVEIKTKARFMQDYEGVDTYNNAVLKAQSEGVTSIFAFGDAGMCIRMSPYATNAQYFPEWLVASHVQWDLSGNVRPCGSSGQLQRAFGLTFKPRELPAADNPAYWALWEAGGAPVSGQGGTIASQVSLEYRELLLLSSGIQMAGPKLTPQTFRDGLYKTRFPNPVTPINAGAVGFPAGSHSMTRDGAEMWWSMTERGYSQEDGPGRWCYVDGGTRRKVTEWPKDGDPFFDQAKCP